ncbi:MAG: hypothetical protein CO129_12205 [Ignavibacteriales bacterium CG_4_9_14_3_um_filter_34_10]|nr:MAG: hypothetical protein CO129_12205 [Ignavibacteriales bacterium CG_4_9_14_3_um_filter_34_10]
MEGIMKKSRFLFSTILLFNFTVITFGQIKWDGGASTTSWTDAANWSGNAVPTDADSIILDNTYVSGNYSVNLAPESSQTVKSLQIGYTGNVNTITLIVSGPTTNALILDGGGASALYLADGGVLSNQSTSGTRGIKLGKASDVFKMSGTGKYSHVTTTSGSGIPELTSGTTSSNYNFESTSFFENLSGNAASFDATPIYGNYILNHTSTNTINNNLSIAGNLEIYSGILNVTSSGTDTLSVSGNVLIGDGATLQGTSTTGRVTVNIIGNVTGTGTLKGNVGSGGTTNYTIGGNITSLISLNTGNTSLTFEGGNPSVNFTAANSSIPTLNEITIGTNKTVTLGDSIYVASGKHFTVNGTLDCGVNRISGAGAFILNANATIKCGHASGVFGNIATLGSNSLSAGANYVFNGLVQQATSALLPDNITGALTIDNALGVFLSSDRTISTGTLNLLNGVLKTRIAEPTVNNLTIGLSATINVTGETSFIDGPVIMILQSGNGRIFPIGKGSAYRPISLNFSVGQDVTAEMFNTAPTGGLASSGVDKISEVRYFSVSNGTSTNITVSLPWGEDDNVTDLTNITAVYGINSITWSGNSRSGSTTGNSSAGTVTGTFNNIIGGDFTLGNISGGSNSLPVELTAFTAFAGKGGVELNWSTATEVNNYGFEIERQILKQVQNDSNGWQKIGFVQGHGNSNSPKDYSFIDQGKVAERSRSYRLKQLDADGSFHYSDVVSVNNALGKSFKLFAPYPNPFNPNTTIKFSIPAASNVSLKIYDIIGNEIANLVNGRKDAGEYEVDFNAKNLPSGIYFSTLRSNGNTQTQKLILMK